MKISDHNPFFFSFFILVFVVTKLVYNVNRPKRHRKNDTDLQHGILDATTTSGDTRVVFSPNSVSAAANKTNWTCVTMILQK